VRKAEGGDENGKQGASLPKAPYIESFEAFQQCYCFKNGKVAGD